MMPFNITKRITNVREHVNWGGGGGDNVVETLPDWMKPYIETAMFDVQKAYKEGRLDPYTDPSGMLTSTVYDMEKALTGDLADLTKRGDASLTQYEKAMAGEFDIDSSGLIDAAASRQAEEAAKRGAVSAGMTSQTGGARARATEMKQSAINAAEFAGINAEAAEKNRGFRSQAAKDLTGAVREGYDLGTGIYKDRLALGKAEQDMFKEQADKDYEALRRYAELYGVGGGATQQATGGK